MLENAAESHTSGTPRNDGGRSFSTKERLAVWTEDRQKVTIFRKKDAFLTSFRCRSENAVLGGFFSVLTNFTH
jgi:hypothetical protein